MPLTKCPFVTEHTEKLDLQDNDFEMEKNNNFEIKICENGPIQVTGKFVLKHSDGSITTEEKEIFLCRCGGSANKPFCDDTHKKIGVRD